MGQLRMLVRDRYLIDAIGFNKVQGKPFAVTELLAKFTELVGAESSDVVQSRAG